MDEVIVVRNSFLEQKLKTHFAMPASQVSIFLKFCGVWRENKSPKNVAGFNGSNGESGSNDDDSTTNIAKVKMMMMKKESN
jgi:hypothetical protein